MGSYYEPKLLGNYEFDEVASSLQKMIRRGKEYESCYWAFVFHTSGFGGYIWRRLSIITCEDLGNAEPLTPLVIDSLASMWERLHKNNKEPSLDKFLLIIQGVLYMCRAKKVRENDSLANLIEEHWKAGQRLEIPEVAKDAHTDIGRRVFGKFGNLSDGKEKERLDLWFLEWSKISNPAYKDKWEKDIKKIWYGRVKQDKSIPCPRSKTDG